MELLLYISQLLTHLPWHRPALPSLLLPLADRSHTYFSGVQLWRNKDTSYVEEETQLTGTQYLPPVLMQRYLLAQDGRSSWSSRDLNIGAH